MTMVNVDILQCSIVIYRRVLGTNRRP